jgi:hypothetical protein
MVVVGTYSHLATASSPNHFWRSISAARITINGKVQTEARVYRHPDGRVLVGLDQYGWYVYLPQQNNMFSCNRIRHIAIPGYIYAHNWDDQAIPCTNMGGIKTETKAELIAQSDSIEFTSLEHERVRVSW